MIESQHPSISNNQKWVNTGGFLIILGGQGIKKIGFGRCSVDHPRLNAGAGYKFQCAHIIDSQNAWTPCK